MKLKYHPRARIELNKEADYYEKRQSGLGWDFLEEIQLTIRRILEFPNAWHPLSANTRRCLTNRFPFGIVYQVKADEIRIIAIAHLKRRLGYWQDRLNES